MAVELYPHNEQTYQKMASMFETSNRVGVVQPTGTGKSFLYLKWIENHPQDHFAILSPSTEIFTQLQEYAESSGSPELLDSVQMISYQSLLKMSDEEVHALHPDKIVLDEFHRTGAEQWGPSLQRLLDTNSNTKVLGASATPVRYLDDSKDMASELFDRNLAVEMTLGEAVQRGILPTPKYVPVWYDLDNSMERYATDISQISNVENRKEMYEKLEQLKRRLENSYGAEDIFQKNMPHEHGKFIVFCRNKEHLEEMIKTVPSWFSKVSTNIRSYVSISEQEDKDLQLQAFKADQSADAVSLLFTIDRLNEGLHVKGIDGVIMLRPTTSPIIYLQQMGRALCAGNKSPLIFDMVNNYQSVHVPLKNGETVNVFEKEFRDALADRVDIPNFRIFEDMVEFTKLFKELDDFLYVNYEDRWNQNFALLQHFVEEYQRFPLAKETYRGINLGQWCSHQKRFANKPYYSFERFEKLKAIGLLDDTLDSKWNQNFALLEQFIAEYRRLPAQRETYCGVNLGSWCSNQKDSAKKLGYPADRLEKLNTIGLFDDSMNIYNLKWEQNFALLQQFIAEYQRLPVTNEIYCGVNLGSWCSNQKDSAKKLGYPADRLEKLNTIGLFDDSMNIYNLKWERNFSVLQHFIEEHQRLPSTTEIYCGVKLGSWCNEQKRNAKKTGYPSERLKKLNAIGLLDDTLDGRWGQNFALLEQFIAEYGRFPIKKEMYCGVNLGRWCHSQQQQAKSDKYPLMRRKKLEDIGLIAPLAHVLVSQKPSLDVLIQSASTRAAESPSIGKAPAKEASQDR